MSWYNWRAKSFSKSPEMTGKTHIYRLFDPVAVETTGPGAEIIYRALV